MNEESKYREALRTPSEVYDSPEDVLRDDSLDNDQKLEILMHWQSEAIELQDSEGEGMGGGERSLLPDIKQAIAQLEGIS